MRVSTADALGGCAGLVLILAGLKLTGLGIVAAWPWWWVAAPLWMPACAALGILLIIIALAILTRGDPV